MEGSSVLPLDKRSQRQLTHSIEESRGTNPSYLLCSTLEFQARYSLSTYAIESVPMMTDEWFCQQLATGDPSSLTKFRRGANGGACTAVRQARRRTNSY